jgi:hypothetical protein
LLFLFYSSSFSFSFSFSSSCPPIVITIRITSRRLGFVPGVTTRIMTNLLYKQTKRYCAKGCAPYRLLLLYQTNFKLRNFWLYSTFYYYKYYSGNRNLEVERCWEFTIDQTFDWNFLGVALVGNFFYIYKSSIKVSA